MHKWLFVFSTLVIVGSWGDDGVDLLAAPKKVLTDAVELAKNALPSGTLEGLPMPSLENLGPINASTIPSIEEGEELIKEKCARNGRNDSFEQFMGAKDTFQDCIKDLVNVEQIQQEIERAKPTGDLDIVFRKYCKKSPMLKSCVNNFTTAVEPCLDEAEKVTKKVVTNITDALVGFICYKEGDRIALFIAEGGPECLKDKQEAVQHCMNTTFSSYTTDETPDLNKLPSFKLEEKECRDINALQLCIVTELEKCKEPTPANIVDSLFNFIRQSTPCAPYKPESLNSAPALAVHSFTALTVGALVSYLVNRLH